MELGTNGNRTAVLAAAQTALVGGPGDDVLNGGPADESLSGAAGNDTLLGGESNDTLSGGVGNDLLIGGPGKDTYLFGRGDGQDRIDAYGESSLDKLAFGPGISLADVDVFRDAATGDLLLSLHGSSDTVRVMGYFKPPAQDRLRVQFADGAVWDGLAIDRKLNYGNDVVSAAPTGMSQTLDGGLGNDQVLGGPGNDILYGDAGNDTLVGGPGNDTYLFGRGDGQDRIVAFGDSSLDKLAFGSGISMADVDVSRDPMTGDLLLSLHGSSDSVRVNGYFNNPPQNRLSIQFADGAVWDGLAIDRKLNYSDDSVSAGPAGTGQTLDGGLGNDQVFGGLGDDILYGDAGNDTLIGGPGNDTYLFGRGDGQDRIVASGDSSLDKLAFGSGISLADVDVSRDPMTGDLLLSLRGSNDSVRVSGYFNNPPQNRLSIRFADGAVWDGLAIERKLNYSDDSVNAGPTSTGQTLDGGLGNDQVFGGLGDDILYGDAGNDTLIGGPGNDTYLFGRGDGQDRIVASGDSSLDKLAFGSGINLADVDVARDPMTGDLLLSLRGSSDSVRVNGYFNNPPQNRLSIQFADGAVWDGLAIDRKLNYSDDSVSAGPAGTGQTIDGGLGNDQVFGGLGDDILYGDAGNDTLIGGPGNDTYLFGRGDGQDRIVAFGDSSLDKLAFGSGISLADVDVSRDPMTGDLLLSLHGSSDSVRVNGYFNNPPENRLSIRFADGAVWDGLAIERKLNYSDDSVNAGPTSTGQTVDGGLGNDQVFGGLGDDILYGDAGNDTLIGGPGNDTYLFGRGDGQDRIVAFGDSSLDKLAFGSGISLADVDVSRDPMTGDLLLSLHGSSDSVRVNGYFNNPPQNRLSIQFADGAVWDGLAIDRKLNYSDDSVSAGPAGTGQTIDGGLGNDQVFGGLGDDILYGDAGNDTLIGGPGNDTYLFGRGDGQDRIVASGDSSLDKLAFGSGISLADVDVSRDPMTGDLLLSLHGSSDSVRVNGYFNNPPENRLSIRFADGAVWDGLAIERKLNYSDDSVNAGPTSTGQTVDGGLGNDQLFGGLGDDILYGDAGNDTLIGGPGNDTYLFGRGDGQDRILTFGDSALDKLQFGSGISLADVDVGVDNGDLVLSLRGSTDSVRVAGYFNMPPQDRLQIRFADGAAWDGLAIERRLQPSDDFVNALPSPIPGTGQTLDGGLGNDQLFGGLGDDILYGDAGNDTLTGAPGADTYLFGRGDGQDRILTFGDSALDKLQFGSGISLADVDVGVDNGDLVLSLRGSTDSVRVAGYFNLPPQDRLQIRFADGAAWDGAAIDRKLQPSDDFVNALPTPIPGTGQTLDGGLGNDQVIGGLGDDILYGDAGNDTLIGGPGNDTYLFGRGDGQDRILAFGDSALDKLQFGSGISLADVDVGVDNGDLVLSLRGSTDSVRVAGYFNLPPQGRLQIRFADGAAWDGLAIDRKLNYSDDFIGAGPTSTGQTVDGGLGNDQLFGGLGDDILYGDAGNDILIGGPGSDTYLFGRDDGQDAVGEQGAAPGDTNVLQFAADVAAEQLWFTRAGNDLQVSIIGTADSATVTGWYLGNAPLVDRFQTANGRVLLDSQVQQLVQAMASFAPPPMGQTTLGDPYQPLLPVIAAQWAG